MKHANNTEARILNHLSNTPGQTPKQISMAIGRTYATVVSTLKIMLGNRDVWSDVQAKYFAVESDGVAEPDYLKHAKQAENLQQRNCFYRAAAAWRNAEASTSRPGLQEKAIHRYQQCMDEANRRSPKAALDFPLKSGKRP